MFKNMASNKTKLQRKKTNELYRIASLSGFNIADFIGQDGTFVLLDDNLREYFTSYTESEKENNLLDLTLKLQSLYKEFEKNGVMKDDCNLLIDNALEIDTNALKLLSK